MKTTVDISDGCIQLFLYPENIAEHNQLEDLMDKKLEIEFSSHLRLHEDNEDDGVFKWDGGDLSKYYVSETEFFDDPNVKSPRYGYPI